MLNRFCSSYNAIQNFDSRKKQFTPRARVPLLCPMQNQFFFSAATICGGFKEAQEKHRSMDFSKSNSIFALCYSTIRKFTITLYVLYYFFLTTPLRWQQTNSTQGLPDSPRIKFYVKCFHPF